MFSRICNLHHVIGSRLEVLGPTTDLLHVLCLLLILHNLPLLVLLTGDLVLMLHNKLVILLITGHLLVQVHTLQPLMIHLIYLLVYVLVGLLVYLLGVAIRDALDARISILL